MAAGAVIVVEGNTGNSEGKKIFKQNITFFLCFISFCASYKQEEREMVEVMTWQARQERGITLKQLEELTGIGKTTLNNIENGLVSPTLNQIEAIARALGVNMSDLYTSDIK